MMHHDVTKAVAADRVRRLRAEAKADRRAAKADRAAKARKR
ncbi:hypothetical protein [Actinomadura rudentiformis]|nr:hypothetical protein [Actinomadura rudentiformis]